MPYPHPIKIDGLLAKVETTYGTDAAPVVGTDGVRVIGRLWSQLGDEYAFGNERENVAVGGLTEAIPAVPRGHMISLDFAVELKGAGVAYASGTPIRPEVDPLLTAAGLARTHDDTVSTESVSYAFADTGHGSATIWAYAGGKLYKIVGCRGNLVWDLLAGELGRMRFVMQGMVASITEIAMPSITYDSVESPGAVSLGLLIGGWTPNVSLASVDLGNDIVRLDDANAADAIDGFHIADRQSRFTVSARAVALSTYDPHTNLSARTVNTIDSTLGSVQYNQIKIDVNDARVITAPRPTDDNRFTGWEIDYLLRDLAILFD